MARRRRDDEGRQPSLLARAGKTAIKAAAVGTTAALFNRSDLGYKVHQLLPVASKAVKSMSHELAGTEKKAIDIKRALDKSVGKGFHVVKKAMGEVEHGKLNLRSTDKGNLVGAIRNLKELSSTRNLRNVVSKARHDDLVHTSTKGKGRAFNQFVKNIYDDIESLYLETGAGPESSKLHMAKTKKHYQGQIPNSGDLAPIHQAKKQLDSTMNEFLANDTNVKAMENMAKVIYNKDTIKANIDEGWSRKVSKKLPWFKDRKGGRFSSFETWLTGGRAATLGDIKNNLHQFEDMSYKDAEGNMVDLKGLIHEWSEKGLGDDTVVDKTLRVRTTGKYAGKMYSTRTWQDGVDKVKKEFAYTMPGRLFKMQDRLEESNMSPVAILRAGKKAFAAGNENNNILQNTMVAVGENLYQLGTDDNGNFIFSGDPVRKGGKVVSTRFGSRARTMRQMLGTDFKMANVSEGGILEKMDIGQSGKEDWVMKLARGAKETLHRLTTGEAPDISFDDHAMDLYKSVLFMSSGQDINDIVLDAQKNLNVSSVDIMMAIKKGAKNLNGVMNDYTSINQLDKDTITKLTKSGVFSKESSKKLMNIYHMVDANNMDKAMDLVEDYTQSSGNGDSFGPQLGKMLKTYRMNAASFNNSVDIAVQHGVDIGTASFDNTVALDAKGMLQKELLKEAFINQFQDEKAMPTIKRALSEAGIHGKQQKDTFALASWGIYQYLSQNDKNASNFTNENILNTTILRTTANKLLSNSGFATEFFEAADGAAKQMNNMFKKSSKNVTEIYVDEISDYDFIRKSSAKDLIKSFTGLARFAGEGVTALMPSAKNYDLGQVTQNVKSRLVERGLQVFDKYVDTYNALESHTHDIGKELSKVDYSEIKDVLNMKDTSKILEYFDSSENGQQVKTVMNLVKKPFTEVSKYLKGTTMETKLNDASSIFDIVKVIKTDAKHAVEDFGPGKGNHIETIKNMVSELTDSMEKINANGIDVRKIIENENLKTIEKAGKSVLSEMFLAGRNRTEDVTDLTFGVFNFFNRLNMGLNDSMLSLSSKSTASTLDFVKNTVTKRILPAMMIYNTASYLNFETRNLTGNSVGGHAANIARMLDIGARRVGAPARFMLGGLKKTSIFAEYWTGEQDMMNADERQEWYDNGYTAVRNGSGWAFSSTEMRGQGISYYKPNYWRVAQSNYYDVSVYGSSDEKWKHSIMPSLRHPLSPLTWAMDRYWLEKKNFEDRPYPLTGKMFEEGTPWGAALNATVGRVLKRQKMLPAARRALKGGMKSVDARSIIERENRALHDEISKNDDVLVLNEGNIRNAQYTPYGNPYENELNITNGRIAGIGKMDNLPTLGGDFGTPTGGGGGGFGGGGGGPYMPHYGESYGEGSGFDIGDFRVTTEHEFMFGRKAGFLANTVITGVNTFIDAASKASGVRSNGGGGGIAGGSAGGASAVGGGAPMQNFGDGAVNIRNLIALQNSNAAFYASKHSDGKYISRNKTGDAIRDIGYSIRQLAGMYNFVGSKILGDKPPVMRYANAGEMTSYTKRFWEGGFAGGGMIGNALYGSQLEIIRRFIPTENKGVISVNPLMNSMPDWIPEQYRTGDPYAQVKMGDARMPGRGYETLNKLHADQFGDYGAFDRFKILGDIAPSSDEYKLWKSIAKQTVQDPNLQAEMKKIEERAYKTSSKYEFFEYSYIKRTKHMNGIVREVNKDGTVTLTDGQKLNVAGIKDIDLEKGSEHLRAGDSVTFEVSKNARMNGKTTPRAIVYKKTGAFAENINKLFEDMGIGTKDYTDSSGLARKGRTAVMARAFGLAPLQEIIAHAPIPFIHNMFFNIESAEESWKNDMVYGSSYKTWDHPIRSYIAPAINKARGQSILQRGMAIGAMKLYNKHVGNMNNGLGKMGAALAMGTFAPDAYAIGSTLWMLKMNSGGGWFQKGTKATSAVSTGLWAMSQLHNPIKATASFSAAFAHIAHTFETSAVWEKATTGRMAVIGAGVGLGLSAFSTRLFTDTNKMFKAWAPHKTKKKWGLDEYFDRLEYIKYHGLYERTLQNADAEGENIRYFFEKLDHNKEKIRKLKRKINKRLLHTHSKDAPNSKDILKWQRQIDHLKSEQQAFTGSKNAKAAVAYRRAMESTIYGLDEDSTIDEILAAVPDQYKDHFKAFMDEDDEKKRKRILKYVPKYLENPLRISWGMNTRKLKSNKRYFGLLSGKKLPKTRWKGWSPNINLKYVKMKTIQNEGMLMSDFGFYESEKAKAIYHVAPSIHDISGPTHLIASGLGIINKFRMSDIMQGQGLKDVAIDVESTTMPGITVNARVRDNMQDKRKVATYESLNALKMLPFI